MSDALRKHSHDHTPKGTDPLHYVVHKIKLSGDKALDDPPEVADRVWTIPIEPDTDGLHLHELFVSLGTDSGGGAVKVFLTNETQAVDLMSAPDGSSSGQVDCTGSLVDHPDSQVFTGDILVVDITDADADARGLTITLFFW